MRVILGISGTALLLLKVCLFAILLTNGPAYVANNLESHKVVESSSLISPESTLQKDPKLGNESVSHVAAGKLYADCLLPGWSKRYVVDAPEGSLASLFYETSTTETSLVVEAEGPVNRTQVAVVWLPSPHIYYVNSTSEIRFLVTNPETYPVNYTFYVDISEQLQGNNSKTLLLQGGKVALHIDLRKDDRVLLELSPADQSKLRIWVFVLYYVVLPERTYKLRVYRQSLHETLYFPADLGRRYYIIIDSVEQLGRFSLASSTYSPTWNQEWFWLAVLSGFLVTAISLFDIRRVRELEKAPLFAVVSCFCWFVTIGLSVSVAGSFSYGTSIYMPLFYLLILSYGLGHALQIYTSHLERRIASRNCPYCGRNVDLENVNYCCGKIVRRVSDAWFLLPLSLGFLFFAASYIVLQLVSTAFLEYSLWASGCGSIIGGIIAWWINRNVYAIRLWKQRPNRYHISGHIRFVSVGLLATGIAFALVSPLLILFLVEGFLAQHAESFLDAHALWLRITIAPLTLSLNVVLWCTTAAILSGFILAYRIRGIFTRSIPEETGTG